MGGVHHGPTNPDGQATWKHYNTSINIAIDIILQYSASLACSLWKKGLSALKVATRANCAEIQGKLWTPANFF